MSSFAADATLPTRLAQEPELSDNAEGAAEAGGGQPSSLGAAIISGLSTCTGALEQEGLDQKAHAAAQAAETAFTSTFQSEVRAAEAATLRGKGVRNRQTVTTAPVVAPVPEAPQLAAAAQAPPQPLSAPEMMASASASDPSPVEEGEAAWVSDSGGNKAVGEAEEIEEIEEVEEEEVEEEEEEEEEKEEDEK